MEQVNAMERLQALATEPWKNTACLGYAIRALEGLGYKPDAIQAVVNAMQAGFDWRTLSEAEQHYMNSPY